MGNDVMRLLLGWILVVLDGLQTWCGNLILVIIASTYLTNTGNRKERK
ncbi:MAG TPA: hypothetical protein VLI55_16965 [Bryobacteraceae bacterium]|nr:hypothetical protein [Bryobacteraceae bacterium]